MPKQFELLQLNDPNKDGYWSWSIEFDASAAALLGAVPKKTRYEVVFPLDLELFAGYLDVTADMDGDRFSTKAFGGPLGNVAAPAVAGASQVAVLSLPQVWNVKFFAGFYVNFGAQVLWAGVAGQQGRVVPDAEVDLAEYLVTKIENVTPVVLGGVTYESALLTLWTPLAADVAANAPVNAVKLWTPFPRVLRAGNRLEFGQEIVKGAEISKGTVLRFEYDNFAAAGSVLARKVVGDLRLHY